MRKFLAIVIICCTFVLAFGLVACGGSSGSASSTASASTSSASESSSAEAQAEAEYNRAVSLFDEGKFYSAKVAFENSKYKDWEQRAAACVQPMPETGELFHDANMKSDNMMLNFIVNEEDAAKAWYITVYTKDNALVESLFIKGSGSVETNLPGGEYYVKDSSGTEWYGADEQFGADGYYETMVFDKVEGDRYLTVLDEGYIWDITINNADGSGQGVGSEKVSWEDRS